MNVNPSTCDRLLDTAEQLFADKGFHATSMRKITQSAGTNLAAVNYHFGSKQALIVAVFRRRLDALNQARLNRLDQALNHADSPQLEAVLDAFVSPAIALAHSTAADGQRFMRILLRAFADRNEQLRRDLSAEYAHVMRRFAEAIHDALPGASRATVRRHLDFIVAALTHTMAESHINDGPAIASDLVRFAAAGLRGSIQPKVDSAPISDSNTTSTPTPIDGAQRTLEIV